MNNKFTPPKGRPAKINSDYAYTKKEKTLYDEDGRKIRGGTPWEYHMVKQFGKIKPNLNLKKENVFDTKGDGKATKKPKEPKLYQDRKPTMQTDTGKLLHLF